MSATHPESSTPPPGAGRTTSSTGLRPGWTEILVGMAGWLVLAFGVATPLGGLDPSARGLALNALSAVAAFGGFAVAALVRIRGWAAFGVRRVSWRWLLIGVGGGVLAIVLKTLASTAYIAITGDTANPQTTYADGASGGTAAVLLSIFLLAVVTPVCEELLFRGVIATALLRYGAVVGVLGSAVIFALCHGLNVITVTALIVGLINAELRRRSGSIWPGVIVHVLNNLLSSVLAFLVLVPG